MSITPLAVAVALAAAVSGCAPDVSTGQSAPSPAPQPSPSAMTQQNPAEATPPQGAPIALQLRGPATVTTPGDIDVELTLTRAGSIEVPLDVTLQVPDGASLVSGIAHELVVDRASTIVRRFRLHLVTVPSGDLQAVVDMKGNGFGARAEAVYRFGRPEPKLPEAQRGQPIVLPGGRNLGAPIPIH